MRLHLKGINTVTKRLSDGSSATYYYAWKGGPRLTGAPGSPEFLASYQQAVTQKIQAPSGTLQSLIDAYQNSDDFRQRAERTKVDYRAKIKIIERKFGTLPIKAIEHEPDRCRGLFLDWRDKLPGASRRQADYAIVVFAAVLSWAKERGKLRVNPLIKPGRYYQGSRRDRVWSDEEERAFLAAVPARMRLPFLLAIWTAQRQGDLLRLSWTAYSGGFIRLRQSKTGARVEIPVSAPLRAALDAAKGERGSATTILVTSDGTPWTSDGFRSSWRKACAKAGIDGLTFHDLRGTAITRLAVAGASEAQIAAVSGLSLKDVTSILDRHYLKRDRELAESAIAKLELRSKGEQILPTDRPTGPVALGNTYRKAE